MSGFGGRIEPSISGVWFSEGEAGLTRFSSSSEGLIHFGEYKHCLYKGIIA